MKGKGWVYVITNKAMPGIIKVGFSMKDPALRAAELNHTGSPHPYLVDYEVLVEDPHKVEQTVHRRLSIHREGKEWFRCSAEEAKADIKEVVGAGAQVENYKRADRDRAETIYRKKAAEEQTRRAVEEERIKQEVVLNERRSEIISRYDLALKAELPVINFLGYFAGVFIIFILGLEFFFPKMKDGALFMFSTIVSFIITPFVKEYFEDKSKESSRYKSILLQRETEINNIGKVIISTPREEKKSVNSISISPENQNLILKNKPFQQNYTQKKKWSFFSNSDSSLKCNA